MPCNSPQQLGGRDTFLIRDEPRTLGRSRMRHARLNEVHQVRQPDQTSSILNRTKRQRYSKIYQTQEFVKVRPYSRSINQRWPDNDALHSVLLTDIPDGLLG